MAKKQQIPADLPARTALVFEFEAALSQLMTQIAKGKELSGANPDSKQSLQECKKQFSAWDEHNGTLLNQMFSTDELFQEYNYWGIALPPVFETFEQELAEHRKELQERIKSLESIVERLPLLQQDSDHPAAVKNPANAAPPGSIFIVHGRNNDLKETVARFIAQLGLTPIIWNEPTTQGLTIVEKFEQHAETSFALILLTPDDVGGQSGKKKQDHLTHRAGQNVIFEWGYFLGQLGRKSVCALIAESVEVPSAVNGIACIKLDQTGGWKLEVARSLKFAGIAFDMNNAI